LSDADPHRQRADDLFTRALQLDPAGRAAFVDAVCGDDARLRDSVHELLALAADEGAELPGTAAVAALWGALEADLSAAPARVGPWRIERELGRGGMGTVHLATRDDGAAEHTAALKLLRPGAASADVVRRFRQERVILERLEHPGIARALDGGLTAEGLPYFAMEYVEGRPLLEYCDALRLGIAERLDVLAQVCQAVHHAHLHLVVHRDLKPSNILVTASGQVKLLDFGIAKALDEGDARDAPTRTIARLLTPEYASPEQVRGQAVTPASDVYQLGLLLYETLSGVRAQRVDGADLASWRAVVCDQRPERPSRAAATGPAASARAAVRGTTPAGLAGALRGGLDTIVLTALRKEPERRYASAARLAEDLERHRRKEPLRARPDSLAYRARTLVRRYPGRSAFAALCVVLAAAHAVTLERHARALARERDRARTEAAKAERVKNFVVGMFAAADPHQLRGDALTVVEALDAGARTARERLRDEPEVLAELSGVLGDVLRERAAYAKAEPLLAEALALRRSRSDERALAAALSDYARVVMERSPAEATPLAREALDMRRRLDGPESVEAADGLLLVAQTLGLQGQTGAAEALVREAIAIRRRPPVEPAPLAAMLSQLGTELDKQGRPAESVAAQEEALALRRSAFPADHPSVSESLNNLAVALKRSGRAPEAEPLLREALASRRRVLGPRHPRVANVLNNLGDLQRALGRPDEAIAHQREALAIRREVFGATHRNVALSLLHLGSALRDAGRLAEAEAPLREGYALYRKTAPPGHRGIGRSALALGRLLTLTARAEEAEPLLREALRIGSDGDDDDPVAAQRARLALGLCLLRLGRLAEARPHLLEAAAVESSRLGDPVLVAEAERALASLPVLSR
jgi:serine/threonine-protein kinase